MNKYIGITIGPIIKTLSIARKPRELWSASFLFSGLMENLIVRISKEENVKIISPGVIKDAASVEESKIVVGLYPDRIFCVSITFEQVRNIIRQVVFEYANNHKVYADYFKVYATEVDAENDGKAVKELNKQLDYLELHNRALLHEAEESVRKLVVSNKLFELKNGSKKFETLAEIATTQLEQLYPNEYRDVLIEARKDESVDEKDELVKNLSKKLEKFITPHKYICVVHADGDNVGTIVGSLGTGKLTPFSENLLKFGKKACHSIEKFQGLPIYAGGDDLLFIAPVVSNDENGNTQTIFDLIKQIDNDFVNSGTTQTTLLQDGKLLKPSLSYGITLTYYKYPLYETLEISRNLLFDVAKELKKKDEKGKEEKVKNAIAWTLQKGSGMAVSGCFSKGNEEIFKAFENLINSIDINTDKNLVSAVAHKLKANETLLSLFMGKENQNDRLDAFFEKILEYKDKRKKEKQYLDAVKEVLIALYKHSNDLIETIKCAYAMLRTAKFIKGLEDDKDE